ncbi:hypothetical protein JX265_007634 [Neoarthrinium moseri]|uniref:BHLH domain-containing protein n=1 Tax=Neoarthrinium moseri TaxID=1658444 RepID=A0A9Q0ANH8_9PEZI|nr:uncharacterized protein JN550_012773 [Neoarthrinium moseri]KAI1854497.1 hypothetical protein JX266_000615 [Neoarthrinium moseri]KAI1858323.1 hypothetical protein JN550_012773 [Neoarthrinium moseri]KAI1867058.1 hypothetical protein JX265_007634 [Neoarthrinium moseri]
MEAAGYSQTEAALEQLNAPPDRAYLTAMAEAVTQEQSDYSAPPPLSPTQKRKRGAPESSPAEPRRAKRGAPAATMSGHPDADSAAYVESAVEAAQAAAAANVNAADFTALQQAAADHHDPVDPAHASSTAAAALGSMYPTLHVPPTTEETFAAQVASEEHQSFGANDMMSADGLPDAAGSGAGQGPQPPSQNGIRSSQPPYDGQNASPNVPKPAVGSEEWHKQRKDNHKEVERRRRETINEGINELAKIVPGSEKNKGSILQRAVSFITQLKQNEAQNIEKWTLEKLLTEQAIQELSSSNDKLKAECERLYRELDVWKQLAQSNGLHPNQSKEEPGSS